MPKTAQQRPAVRGARTQWRHSRRLLDRSTRCCCQPAASPCSLLSRLLGVLDYPCGQHLSAPPFLLPALKAPRTPRPRAPLTLPPGPGGQPGLLGVSLGARRRAGCDRLRPDRLVSSTRCVPCPESGDLQALTAIEPRSSSIPGHTRGVRLAGDRGTIARLAPAARRSRSGVSHLLRVRAHRHQPDRGLQARMGCGCPNPALC